MTVLRTETIPLPPADPALPALGTALTGAAAGEVLAQSLLHPPDGSLELRSCRPCYVRYKPGTNCLVQYQLTLEDAGAGCAENVLVHMKLYADGRAGRLWARGSLQRLARAAAEAQPQPPLGRVAYLPELQALVQVVPVDVELPALAVATSDEGRRQALPRALGRGASQLREGAVELVRYKPARKALLRYGAAGEPVRVYAKLHTDERGARVLAAEEALRESGLAVAAALAYVPSLRMLVHAEAPGTPLGELRGTSVFDRCAEAAG